MRKLKGNWTDIFNGFSVALDIKKLFAAYIGLFLSFIVIGAVIMIISRVHSNMEAAATGSGLKDITVCFGSGILWKLACLAAGACILLLLVWSYFGGIICRIAAVNLTKDEGLEMNKAMSFTAKKYISFFSPYIFAILGFAFLFFLCIVCGWIGLIPYAGEIIVAILLPLIILLGFIMVFIAIGLKYGGILFFPTIAVESSDAFDAISRSFQYLYSEPWRYIWYCMVACVYGIITTVFVFAFGLLMIAVPLFGLYLGMHDKFNQIFSQQPDSPVTYGIGVFIAAVWLILIVGLIISYVISYCFSARTIIYLLLRKKVDDIDMNEIYEEEATLEELGAPAPTGRQPNPTETSRPGGTTAADETPKMGT